MGVPRLFRILAERFPQIVKDCGPCDPQFDNLYLDFNGIIHTCTHNNNNDDSAPKTERAMMMSIFSALQTVLETAMPQRLLFIAIDGVAPRAKMNQQRQRRFRAAANAATAAAAAEADGVMAAVSAAVAAGTPAGAVFDSNCITPGSAFMSRLEEFLVYFIQRKLEFDPSWRSLEVFFSGHQTPGEGEHKIMEFVRSLKSRPDYAPNTRHCLHGLDADLILLALALHEPHFCILREKQLMRRGTTKQALFQQTNEFQLLYVSLLREYLELELLQVCASHTNRPQLITLPQHNMQLTGLRLERAIDDFIFMTFLIGNDFLPHLVTVDIDEEGLGALLDLYTRISTSLRVLRPHDEIYLVDAAAGAVNIFFLETMFALLAEREPGVFAKPAKGQRQRSAPASLASLAKEESADPVVPAVDENAGPPPPSIDPAPVPVPPKKTALAAFYHPSEIKSGRPAVAPANLATANRALSTAPAGAAPAGAAPVVAEPSAMAPVDDPADAASPPVDEESAVPIAAAPTASPTSITCKAEFNAHHFPKHTPEQVAGIYLQGLIWALRYYYQGLPSWTWFYPFYSSPLPSDMVNLASLHDSLTLDPGHPLLPFQQLLAVLPSASASLLPSSLAALMTGELAEWYPSEYAKIPDPKGREWREVALIPFIDVSRLAAAYDEAVAQTPLTPEESARNELRTGRIFVFSATSQVPNTSPTPHLPSHPAHVEFKNFTPWY